MHGRRHRVRTTASSSTEVALRSQPEAFGTWKTTQVWADLNADDMLDDIGTSVCSVMSSVSSKNDLTKQGQQRHVTLSDQEISVDLIDPRRPSVESDVAVAIASRPEAGIDNKRMSHPSTIRLSTTSVNSALPLLRTSEKKKVPVNTDNSTESGVKREVIKSTVTQKTVIKSTRCRPSGRKTKFTIGAAGRTSQQLLKDVNRPSAFVPNQGPNHETLVYDYNTVLATLQQAKPKIRVSNPNVTKSTSWSLAAAASPVPRRRGAAALRTVVDKSTPVIHRYSQRRASESHCRELVGGRVDLQRLSTLNTNQNASTSEDNDVVVIAEADAVTSGSGDQPPVPLLLSGVEAADAETATQHLLEEPMISDVLGEAAVVADADNHRSSDGEVDPQETVNQEDNSTEEKMEESGTTEEESVLERPMIGTKIKPHKEVVVVKPKIRRCIAEDFQWNLKTAQHLDELTIKHIADDFSVQPYQPSVVSTLYESQLVCQLSTSLPLTMVVDRVSDEMPHGDEYWRRRCEVTWPIDHNLDHQAEQRKLFHRNQNEEREEGCWKYRASCRHRIEGSWKRLFFERRLTELIEAFVPRLCDLDKLERDAAIGGRYVRRLDIGQMLPPIHRPRRMPRIEDPNPLKNPALVQDTTEGIRPDVNEDGSTAVPVDHVNLTGLSTHLPCLNELRITYGSRSCGLNFDWNVHHFTLQDCAWLAELVVRCQKLCLLEVHRCRIDDTRVLMLSKGLEAHPSLSQLHLPFNEIADDGARIISRLLDHNGQLIYSLDLQGNRIGPDGALAISFMLTRNSHLKTLKLRHNLLGDAGCASISQALTSAKSALTELELSGNGFTEEAAYPVGRMIAVNTSLTRLDLSCNTFGEAGGQCLMESLQSNGTLVDLDIRSTGSGIVNMFYVRIRTRDNLDALNQRQLAATDHDELGSSTNNAP